MDRTDRTYYPLEGIVDDLESVFYALFYGCMIESWMSWFYMEEWLCDNQAIYWGWYSAMEA